MFYIFCVTYLHVSLFNNIVWLMADPWGPGQSFVPPNSNAWNHISWHPFFLGQKHYFIWCLIFYTFVCNLFTGLFIQQHCRTYGTAPYIFHSQLYRAVYFINQINMLCYSEKFSSMYSEFFCGNIASKHLYLRECLFIFSGLYWG